MSSSPREEPDRDTGQRDRKTGSRIFLAAALAGGVFGALFAGARISDFLCDVLGIASNAVRLGMKVAAIVVALPAGFYLVERYFLSRSNRDGAGDAGAPGRKRG